MSDNPGWPTRPDDEQPGAAPPPQWGQPPQGSPPQGSPPPQWGQQPHWGQQPQWQPQPGQPPQWGAPGGAGTGEQAGYGQPAYGGGPGWAGYGGYGPAQPGGGWGMPPAAYKPGVIPLRPLGVGEILDGSLAAIRQYPKAFLGLAAAVMGTAHLIQFVLVEVALRDLDVETGEGLGAYVSGSLAGILLTLLGSLVLSGMLTVAMGEAVLGRPVDLGAVWRTSRPRIIALVGASLLTLLLAFVGFLAFCVGAIFVWVSLSLATPALMLERQQVIPALRRSYDLVKGAWWRTFGILLLLVLITTIISNVLVGTATVVFGGGTAFLTSDPEDLTTGVLLATTLAQIVASTVVEPFRAGAVSLLYVDRRMRAEGLDVTLAQAAQQPQPPQSPAGMTG